MARSKTTINPGEGKTRGRRKNIPNKRTSEAMEIARIEAENAMAPPVPGQPRKKLGKDVLEEFMMLFAGMAATYQPLPDGVAMPGRKPDEAKFLKYAELTVTTAKALADYQSPKFRAIYVAASPDQNNGPRGILPAGDNVLQLNDPIAMARVYQRMVKQVR